ncbi:MAG: NAD-dependent epimerase/dehydratase family protein, partial [Bacteroidota bacterium]
MKVLVTGASGFLGGRLTKALHQHPDYEVLAVSRNLRRHQEFTELGIDFRPGDLMDDDFAKEVLLSVDHVVHCAALSSPWGTYAAFFDANVRLTSQLMHLGAESGILRFVYISTPSLYFDYTDRLNIRESDPLPRRFVNAYAETKFKAERFVLSRNGLSGETISLRPRAIIGAEDGVLFPRLMRAYETGRLRIIGDGTNQADFTCVRNLIDAIICALKADVSACGQAYNISNGQPVNLWDEVNYLFEAMGLAPVQKKVPYAIARNLARVLEAKSRWLGGGEPKLTQYGVGVMAKSFSLNIERA